MLLSIKLVLYVKIQPWSQETSFFYTTANNFLIWLYWNISISFTVRSVSEPLSELRGTFQTLCELHKVSQSHIWVTWEFPALPPFLANDLTRYASRDENRFQVLLHRMWRNVYGGHNWNRCTSLVNTELLGVADTHWTHELQMVSSNLYWDAV
jgi:hypothetical protein